jgi:Fe-S-cluster containining protein
VITDLVQIERLGEKKRRENEGLRRHMKMHDVPERRLRRIAEEIEDQIDCTQCANCCRVATAKLLERDVERLAKLMRLSIGEFKVRYTMEDPEDGLILKRDDATGCVFLSGTACTVYESRPAACENFPHLVRGQGSIASRMWQFIDRATYCPIVYNSLEAFKPVLGFKGLVK